MKLYLILALLILSTFTYSQQIDSLAFFQVKNDTVTFYLNDIGDIVSKSKASFYRVAQLDKRNLNYTGLVRDYFTNNQKAYECNYVNGALNGYVIRYYSDGNLRYSGRFKNSEKDSTWVFYYNNSNIEKLVEYKNNEPYIMEFNNKNGKQVFTNGNGRYSSTITYGHKQPLECTISGEVKNGKMEGRWKWQGKLNNGVDFFSNGKYVKSAEYGVRYTPTVQAVSITGFDPHEFVDVFKFSAVPLESNKSNVSLAGIPVDFKGSDLATFVSFNSDDPNNQPLKYKKSSKLNKELTADLTAAISETISKNQILGFWCFVQFMVTANNNVEKVNVYSNNDIISGYCTEYLTSIKEFEAPKINNTTVNCSVYLNLIFENNMLYFPEYSYGDLSFDLFNTK